MENNTTQELMLHFSDRNKCRDYILSIKHKGGYKCRKCGSTHYHELAHRGGSWQCAACGYQESARHNTIMARSKIPVEHWLRVIVAILGSTKKLAIKELQWTANVDTYGATRMIQLRVKPVMEAIAANKPDISVRDLIEAVVATAAEDLDSGSYDGSGDESMPPLPKVAMPSVS